MSISSFLHGLHGESEAVDWFFFSAVRRTESIDREEHEDHEGGRDLFHSVYFSLYPLDDII
jgi:hypothetical protein